MVYLKISAYSSYHTFPAGATGLFLHMDMYKLTATRGPAHKTLNIKVLQKHQNLATVSMNSALGHSLAAPFLCPRTALSIVIKP